MLWCREYFNNLLGFKYYCGYHCGYFTCCRCTRLYIFLIVLLMSSIIQIDKQTVTCVKCCCWCRYERVNALKKKNANLKTMLAVGGWTLGTEKMTAMLASASSRHEFVTSSIAFLRGRHFDGLSLDFAYPGGRDSPPEDKRRYTLLCHVSLLIGRTYIGSSATGFNKI